MAVRLSFAAIEKMKADPVKRREIADAGKPGLFFIIQPSGKKSWAVRYRFQGQSRKLTLAGFPSLATARKLAQDALDAVAEGRDPARERKAERNTPSNLVEVVFAEFMAKHVKKKNGAAIRASTRAETGRLLGLKQEEDGTWTPCVPKSGVLKHWTGRDIQSITKRDCLNVVEKKIAEGSPIAANRLLSALKTVFKFCVQRDILEISPVQYLEDLSPENKLDRSLSSEEIVACWNAAGQMLFPYGPLVRLILLVGQRRDEIRCLVRPEIDFTKRLIQLPPERTKNGHKHDVPLSDAAFAIIEKLPDIHSRSGWLFATDESKPVSNLSQLKKKLDALMLEELRKSDPAAQLKPWRIHDLRHTLKTWMQEARIPKDVRNAVQNHFDGDMDEHYGHYTFAKEKREALDAWARHVDSLVTGSAANIIPLRRA
jgi:integrase